MTSYALYILAMIALIAAVLALALWPKAVDNCAVNNKKNLLLLAVIITFGSVSLYAVFGGARVVPLVFAHQQRLEELKLEIAKHSQILVNNPENLEAWLSLAQAYSAGGDYAEAARGFKQAVLLSRGHPRIIAAYAEALVMQAGGTVTMQAKKSLDIALMISPDLPLARYYQAIWLLQNNRAEEAMQTMKTLYRELPDDSNLKIRINELIGRENKR